MTATLEQVEPTDRRRSPRLLLALAAAVLTLALVAGAVVAFTPVLGVRRVTVLGVHTLSAAQVLQAADVKHGTPLIRLDTAAVRGRVEELPDVASAGVRVSYPSTVTITVLERVPVGYVVTGGGFALVDRTGRQYRTVAVQPAGLPHFDVPAGPGAQAGGAAAAQVAAVLSPAVLAQVAAISVADPSSISLILRDARTVQWGAATSNAEKARLLPALLARPGSSYDVSDPDLVVVR